MTPNRTRARPAETPPTSYEFGPFLLDTRGARLTRDGSDVRLAPQPMRLLEHLVERADELVTREQMRDLLWPGQVVEFDQSLNFAIRKIRAALDEDADTPRYLVTVPGRGYRFVGATPLSNPALKTPSRARRAAMIVAAGVFIAIVTLVGFRWLNPPVPITIVFEAPASTSAPTMAVGVARDLRATLTAMRAVRVVDPGDPLDGFVAGPLGPLRLQLTLTIQGEIIEIQSVVTELESNRLAWEGVLRTTPDRLDVVRDDLAADIGDALRAYRRGEEGGTFTDEVQSTREGVPPSHASDQGTGQP